MPKFEMMSGHHVDARVGKVQSAAKAGSLGSRMASKSGKRKRVIVDHDVNLDFIHGGTRFRRLDGMKSTGPRDDESPPVDAAEGDQEEVEEVLMAAPVRKLRNPRNDAEADSDLGGGRSKVRSGKANAELDETSSEEDEGDESNEQDEGQEKGDEGETEDGGEKLTGPRDSKDVTARFKDAPTALVKVFKDKNNKYVVTDEDDVTKPLPKADRLANAKAVHKFIKSYNKG